MKTLINNLRENTAGGSRMKVGKLFVILLVSCLFLSMTLNLKANGWLGIWEYRKTFTFSDDYDAGNHLNFTITFSDLDGNCQEDFDDLRITDLDENLLPVWNETTVPGDYVRLWMESNGNSSYYVFYGNPNAENVWVDPEDVFAGVYDDVQLALLMNEEPCVIIFDEDFTGWHETERSEFCTDFARSGNNSFKLMPEQYNSASIYFEGDLDLSQGTYFTFWFYGNNTGSTWGMWMSDDEETWETAYIADHDFVGWRLISVDKSNFITDGTPDWEHVNYITLAVNGQSDTDPHDCYFDRIILTNGEILDHSGNGNDVNFYYSGLGFTNEGWFGRGLTWSLPPQLAPYHYDFDDKENKVTESGYESIVRDDLYLSTLGFGWDTFCDDRDRSLPDDLRRDLNFYTSDRTFKVDLAQGYYTISLIMGDQSSTHDFMDVSAEGVLKLDNLNNTAGSFNEVSFSLWVTDGQLTLLFHDDGGTDGAWVVNAMTITPDISGYLFLNPPVNMVMNETGCTIMLYGQNFAWQTTRYVYGWYATGGGYGLVREHYTTGNCWMSSMQGDIYALTNVTEDDYWLIADAYNATSSKHNLFENSTDMYPPGASTNTPDQYGAMIGLWIGHGWDKQFNGTISGVYWLNQTLTASDMALFHAYYPDPDFEEHTVYLRTWLDEMPSVSFGTEQAFSERWAQHSEIIAASLVAGLIGVPLFVLIVGTTRKRR